jgi:uncharacterized Zn finger protein
MGYWDWYPKSQPRRPANGIKAQSGRQFGKTWWASQWLAALERLIDPGRLSRGRSYARSGQVLNLDIKAGRVDSKVQGSRPSPYKVTIEIKPLSEKEWGKVADAMAEQAIFAAKLLAGEMPQTIEEAFAAAKVNLFPASKGDLTTECSCPDWSNPCKHIAAVYLLLGEQFDADPFLLFRLRGKSKQEVMALLRTRRTAPGTENRPAETISDREASRRGKAPPPSEPVIPLEESLERFWEAEDTLDDFRVQVEPPTVDAVPVKRLGAPGFGRNSKVDLVGALAQAYRAISAASQKTTLGTGEKSS